MTRTLQLDGRRAAFDESGLATAPAILLIHGAGHDRGVWQAVTAGLAAAGRRVIVPDLPGHGDSAGEAAGAVDTMAAWVLAFADAAGLERFELAGHSMGSLIALAAATAAPARIVRLHLLGSLAPMPVAPLLLEAARNDPAQAGHIVEALPAHARSPGVRAAPWAKCRAASFCRQWYAAARALTTRPPARSRPGRETSRSFPGGRRFLTMRPSIPTGTCK